jgi:C1A family cysteine protease
MPYTIKHYGWTRDLPDHRDHLYAAPPAKLAALPTSMDLRPQCPPVYDQGQLGSCTANAIAGAIQFNQMKQKLNPVFTPSRLFIYYNERAIEGTVASDSGAQIRDGVKSVGQQGDCPETEWPYDIAKFAQKPSPSCYTDARKYKVVTYQRVTQVASQIKGCLAAGYPFVFGFTVYQSFESPAVAQSGVLPMPQPGEPSIGGHAVMAVGYDDARQSVIVRNSWGNSWGQAGYFLMPYGYITDPNLANDFWQIQVVL